MDCLSERVDDGVVALGGGLLFDFAFSSSFIQQTEDITAAVRLFCSTHPLTLLPLRHPSPRFPCFYFILLLLLFYFSSSPFDLFFSFPPFFSSPSKSVVDVTMLRRYKYPSTHKENTNNNSSSATLAWRSRSCWTE